MKSLINRRKFLTQSLCTVTCAMLPGLINSIAPQKLHALSISEKYTKEAMFYKTIEKNMVQCELCPNECKLKNGKRSKCLVKEHKNGKLYSLVYNYPNVLLTEPIEKEPVYHFKPGAKLFAIATSGCPIHCKYCQNWQLALTPPDKDEKKKFYVTPEQGIKKAVEQKCDGFVFTYNDPVANYEYVYEISKKAQKAGFFNVVATGGYIHKKPLKKLCQHTDVYIVGLKGFNEKFYQDIIRGELKFVLDTLVTIKEENLWLEIINLIVPGLNDDMKTIRKMCKWVYKNLGNDVPFHFSRFWPRYQLTNLPPTPQVTLECAREIALETGIKYVYIGNLPGHDASNTYCPKCGKMLIQRLGFSVEKNYIINGKCKFCGTKIQGIWKT